LRVPSVVRSKRYLAALWHSVTADLANCWRRASVVD
jgi:hypothetical protein